MRTTPQTIRLGRTARLGGHEAHYGDKCSRSTCADIGRTHGRASDQMASTRRSLTGRDEHISCPPPAASSPRPAALPPPRRAKARNARRRCVHDAQGSCAVAAAGGGGGLRSGAALVYAITARSARGRTRAVGRAFRGLCGRDTEGLAKCNAKSARAPRRTWRST